MFREWLDNPIFIKHVRSRLRPQALGTSVAVTFLICLCIMYGTYQSSSFSSPDGFAALIVLQFVLLAIMGSTQVGASVATARSSGILDFHRVSPQSPLELALGFLFGAPIREYLLTALTMPFMLFCVMMGYPDFRDLFQIELLLFFTAVTLHAISLVGGLAMKGTMTGQNALGFTIVIGIFVVGPLFGAFRWLTGLLRGETHLDLFFLPLPWLAFVILHMAVPLTVFMIAATRKMESERLHGLTKPQALASMATLGLLAVGGVTNWDGDGAYQMFVVYALAVGGMVFIGLSTPSQAEYEKGLRRARKLGRPGVPIWSDLAPNRPAVAVMCGILLAAGSIVGTWLDETNGNGRGVPSQAGFSLSIAVAVLVVAYFGLAMQYFLLRFGRRSANYFGLFLFVAWALPLVLGIITIASIGPRGGDPRPATIFSATPIVGIAAASGVFANEAGDAPAMVSLTLALLFAFVFNMLYVRAVRQSKSRVEAADPEKLEVDPMLAAPEPAAAPA